MGKDRYFSNGKLVMDPRGKIRPTKQADENYLIEKGDFLINLETIEVTENMFPRKKNMSDEENGEMVSKNIHSQTAGYCILFAQIFVYILSFIGIILLPLFIAGFVVGIVWVATNFRDNEDSPLVVIGILFIVFGSIGGSIITMGIFFGLMLMFQFTMMVDQSFKKKLQENKDLNTLRKVKQYLKHLTSNNQIEGGELYVECWHLEKKKKGFFKYSTRVASKFKTIPIKYEVTDNTIVPDFESIETEKIHLVPRPKVILDPQSKQLLIGYADRIRAEYSKFDENIDIYYVPFRINNVFPPFKFIKKGFGYSHSILSDPCGSITGIFCILSCCIFSLNHKFFSGFFTVPVNITKNVKLFSLPDSAINGQVGQNKLIPQQPLLFDGSGDQLLMNSNVQNVQQHLNNNKKDQVPSAPNETNNGMTISSFNYFELQETDSHVVY